jgi:hypothetical protein
MANELPPHVKLGIEKEQWDMKQQEAKNNKHTDSLLTDVKIVGVNISFMNLVSLLVKLAIAAIPAAIIVTVFWTVIGGFLVGLLNV